MNEGARKNAGWIKAYRYWLDDPIILKNSNHLAIWAYLNLLATHQPREVEFQGKKYLLKPGELITGRISISERLNIHDSMVQRILKCFSMNGLIKQKTTNKNRLVRIISWDNDQNSEHQNAHQKNSGILTKKVPLNNILKPIEQKNEHQGGVIRTTIEQQSNTYNNDKNIKNDKEEAVKPTNSSAKQVNECFSIWNRKAKKSEIIPIEGFIMEFGIRSVSRL